MPLGFWLSAGPGRDTKRWCTYLVWAAQRQALEMEVTGSRIGWTCVCVESPLQTPKENFTAISGTRILTCQLEQIANHLQGGFQARGWNMFWSSCYCWDEGGEHPSPLSCGSAEPKAKWALWSIQTSWASGRQVPRWFPSQNLYTGSKSHLPPVGPTLNHHAGWSSQAKFRVMQVEGFHCHISFSDLDFYLWYPCDDIGPMGAFCNSVTKSRTKIPAQTSVLERQCSQSSSAVTLQ